MTNRSNQDAECERHDEGVQGRTPISKPSTAESTEMAG